MDLMRPLDEAGVIALAEQFPCDILQRNKKALLAHDAAMRAENERLRQGLEAGCCRSHPHEEMDEVCILKTENVRLTHENYMLKTGWPDMAVLERQNKDLTAQLAASEKAHDIIRQLCEREGVHHPEAAITKLKQQLATAQSRIAALECENERLKSEMGYHEAKDVIAQLTAQLAAVRKERDDFKYLIDIRGDQLATARREVWEAAALLVESREVSTGKGMVTLTPGEMYLNDAVESLADLCREQAKKAQP